MMRLRLVIQRNGLPATRVIWTIQSHSPLEQQTRAQPSIAGPSYRQYSSRENSVAASFNTIANSFENSGYTVSQLLADVNEVIPIEAHPGITGGSYAEGQWALEDYIVEFLGSECLHFMEVDQLFKDGDEVVIRPLGYEDLAARRLTGRHQIATDGTHLIDGVPFGQRYMKKSATWRPPITIPPRNKRRRLENGVIAGIHSNTNSPVVRYASRACDSQQGAMVTDDRHPENGTPGLENGENRNAVAEAIEFSRPLVNKHNTLPVNAEMETGKATSPRTRQKRRSFDFEKSNKSTVLNLLRANSTSYSEEHLSSSSVSSSDEEVSSPASISTTSGASDSLSATSTSSSDDSSISDTDSHTRTKVDPAAAPSKNALIVINPPGKGSNKTKHNNFRVKLRRRLTNLKNAGLLPKNANFEDLRAWDTHHGEHDVQVEEGETHTKPDSNEATEFERKRAQLLQDLQSGGVEVGYSPGRNRKSKQLPKTAAPGAFSKNSDDVVSPALPEKTVQTSSEVSTAPDRSKRLDLASTRRLLFGSLGVKTPKTKDEEEETRNKLSKKVLHSKVIDKDPPPSVDGNALRSETISPLPAWQDKIMLKATECVYDDIILTTPPFPFIQRWDSGAQEAVKSYKWHQQPRGKKRKRNRKECAYERYNEEWANTNTDVILDYDGAGEDNDTVQNTSQSILQVNKNNNEAPDVDPDHLTAVSVKESSLDGLLISPEEISALGDATANELRPGAVIAFKQLDVSKATNWQPCVSSYRIAEVEEMVESSLITVRLAKRDRTRLTVHDEETDGRRQYSKFEMPGYDEGEVEDDGVREIDPQQLIEPKLVYPAPTESLREEVAVTPDAHLPVLSLDPAATSGHESPSQAKTNLDIPSPAPDISSQLLEEGVGFSSKADSDLYIPGEQSSGHQVGSAQNEQLIFHSENSDYSPILGSPVFTGFRSSPSLENPSIFHRSPSISQLNSTVPPSEPLLPFVSQNCTDQILGSSDGIGITASSPGRDAYNAPLRDQKLSRELQTSSVDFPQCDSQLLASSFVSATGEPAPEEQLTTHQSASDNSSVVTNPFYDVDQMVSDSCSHTPTGDMHVSSGKPPDIEAPEQKGHPISRIMTPDDMTDPVPSSQIGPVLDDNIDQMMDSQVPQGSCVVDLTLTSDPIPSDNSDGDFMPPRKPTKRKSKRRNTREASSGRVRDSIDVERGQSRPRRKRSQLHRSLV